MTKGQTFARDFYLATQLQRSAVSIMASIAVGFERNRLAEFHQFLSGLNPHVENFGLTYTLPLMSGM
jgi:hypothetical protein